MCSLFLSLAFIIMRVSTWLCDTHLFTEVLVVFTSDLHHNVGIHLAM